MKAISLAPVLSLLIACGHFKNIGTDRHLLKEGSVESTANPQVALYSIAPRSAAEVAIQFGLDQRYGLQTYTRRADGNRPLRILVAGMLPNSVYHMRARIRFPDGAVVEDDDQTFRTGPLPARMRDWRLESHRISDAALEPGLELLNSSTGTKSQVAIADLEGRILWSYEMPERQTTKHIRSMRNAGYVISRAVGEFGWKLHAGPLPDALAQTARHDAAGAELARVAAGSDLGIINPVKVLPNGDFLLLFGLSSQSLLSGPSPQGTFSALREIDLAGESVRQITADQLNRKLHDRGYSKFQLQNFHHDVLVLPNGHWIVIANQFRPGSDPGQHETDIFGDDLIELDENLNPVWVWSAFDHLDINRRPMWSPDWTHSNAVIYSPDDGNLLLSMRHQSWIMKIDYRNGSGTGKVLWKLGAGGDFRLQGGRDPQDWQYAQHLPAILGPRSAGVFRLTMVDNGDDRHMQDGSRCADPGSGKQGPPCYTTIPIFEVNEKTMTARIVARKVLPPEQYSTWGGGTVVLPDGRIEATLSSQGNDGKPGMDSEVLEMEPDKALAVLWSMKIRGTPVYRAQRIPSLYPGVRWWSRHGVAPPAVTR